MDFAQMILNPGVLAALQAQGNPMGKALMEQSLAQRQIEAQQAQAAKHRFDMEQQLKQQAAMQMLPDVVKKLNPANMQDAIAQLLAAGVNPSMLNSIVSNIKPDMQDKFNPVTGEIVRFQNGTAQGMAPVQSNNNMKTTNNVNTGNLSPRSQQLLEELKIKDMYKPPMTAQDKAYSNKLLYEAQSAAKGGKETQKYIRSLYDAFDQYDANSGKNLKSGSMLLNPAIPAGASQLFMNDKQRAQAQIINKQKGQLAKEMFKSGLGASLGHKSEQEIIKALPDISLLPEARRQILYDLASKASDDQLKNKFFNSWRKANQGDMNGADIAYDQFVKATQPFDTQGFIKEGIDNLVDSVVKEMFFSDQYQQELQGR